MHLLALEALLSSHCIDQPCRNETTTMRMTSWGGSGGDEGGGYNVALDTKNIVSNHRSTPTNQHPTYKSCIQAGITAVKSTKTF